MCNDIINWIQGHNENFFLIIKCVVSKLTTLHNFSCLKRICHVNVTKQIKLWVCKNTTMLQFGAPQASTVIRIKKFTSIKL